MKPLSILFAIMLVSSCSSSDSSADTVAESGDRITEATEAAGSTDPNEGSHRYRYVESVEHPENDCSTSAQVGDELTQQTTFTDSLVTIVFIGDDLPEGVEPGRRDYDDQLDEHTWLEVQEASDGSTMEHIVEFTDSGIIMTTRRDGADCFYSVRERIDA